MLDLLVRGGTVIDGSGAPRYVGDVAVRDGRIVAVGPAGTVDEGAERVIDADGLVVAPGFVDPHTHYDAQLFWDPTASVSSNHGVTSVVAGNCGFSIAPLAERDADYILDMLARVEGMSTDALRAGVPWSWRTFADYLDALDGRTSINAGFMVGHSAIRRNVMGEAAVGEVATEEQVQAMVRVLEESLAVGGLGFSTTFAPTHFDGEGQPVPSRHAARTETLALCEAVSRFPGTSLEGAFAGSMAGFDDDEVAFVVAMTTTAGRPLNWNVLTIDAAEPAPLASALGMADAAAAAGGRVVALTLPVPIAMNMNFLTFCALHHIPGWSEILSLPVPERIARLQDPSVQRYMLDQAATIDGGFMKTNACTEFATYRIGDTFSSANAGLSGQIVGDIAAARGAEPFPTLIDIVCADDLRTILWPTPAVGDDTWALRASMWDDPRVLIGGSDAGAHLDRILGASYTTRFLADTVRGRQLVSLERAVQLITSEPADLFGVRDRGRLVAGAHADLALFDPATVGAEEPRLSADMPGGGARLVADSYGIEAVFVNGTQIIDRGRATGARPGRIIRSGLDTSTPPLTR